MTPANFTQKARRDIMEASHWIAKDHPTVAINFREVIKQAAITLGAHPLAGSERPNLVNRPFRIFILTGFPYIMVYNPTIMPPLILRVFHGARDLPELLNDL